MMATYSPRRMLMRNVLDGVDLPVGIELRQVFGAEQEWDRGRGYSWRRASVGRSCAPR